MLGRSPGTVDSVAEGGPEPIWVDPPEVVLTPVDERHRDLIAVAAAEVGVGVDVGDLEEVAGLGADLGHHLDGLVTQVTARAAEDAYPGGHVGHLGWQR